MIIQEPVQAAIWHCLNHYSYVDAIFLAERLYAEVDTDDALFLLATCYFRSGKPNRAYSILRNKGCKSSQCRFLLARCCLELDKLNEVEVALTGGNVVNGKSNEETTLEFGDSACFVEQLIAGISKRTERHKKAADSYRKSLKLNPFLWSSYDALCVLGEKPDPNKIFQVSSLENFNMCQGSNPLVQLVNLAHNTDFTGQSYNSTDTQEINTSSTPVQLFVSSHTTPLSTVAVVQTASSTEDLLSPEQSGLLQVQQQQQQTLAMQTQSTIVQPSITRSRYSCFRSFFGDTAAISPLTPSFGLLPLDAVSPLDSTQNCANYVTPPTTLLIESQLGDQKLATKKTQVVRRSQTLNPTNNKPTVFSQSGNANNTTKVNNIVSSPTSQVTLPPSAMASVRRSTRLFSSSNSVKENNKSSSKVRFTSSKAPPRKAKTRLSKNSVTQATFNELNEINKSDSMSTENKPGIVTATHHAVTIQKAVAEGLMLLLQDLGKAYLHLAQYDCKLAIKAFCALPSRHYNTGWVLTNLGRAHFELAEYQQAAEIFSTVRLLEPHRMEGLEYYSTTLWHLQREIGLSTLAKEMTDFEKNCPQAWCAVGNCYSLQKEHDTAIKFFQRAVQVDPKFAYAYTLLGHEYVLTEEMDKAMSCFRNAIGIDPRHYNAWYGVGMIFFKQEKFRLAEFHYRKALSINSQSSVLMCHIGVVQHNLQRSECALETFNKAINSDPKNPLCKFQRATVYFTTDRPHEALKELEELKELVPKESLVYFLLGKVHKKLGNTHLALMNFSWAMDLDPKGANNQIKEAIDKRYTNDDDDVIATNVTVLEESQAVDMEIIDQVSQHGLAVDAEEDHLPTSDESF